MRPVGIVILAAGGSTRLGRPKQLLEFQGTTLLRHAAQTACASEAQAVVLVLGANADILRPEAAGLPLEIIENPDWQAGMGFSLRAGLAALRESHADIEAALFMVCDQPLVSPALLNQIISAYQQSAASIVASEYGGETGVPALFARSRFPKLEALPDNAGARSILTRHAARVTRIPFPKGAFDIDTDEDYRRLLHGGRE